MRLNKMLIILVFFFIKTTNFLFCQEGVFSANYSKPSTKGFFVGISEYKDFPKLNYAHKDAIAIHHFFEEKANLNWCKLLLNEAATSDSIMLYLTKLYQEVVKGDTVVIFLSGHGDEMNVYNEIGYFIGYNTDKNYYNTNGVSFNEIHNILVALSVKKEAKVYFFVDACRAGMINKIPNGPGLSLMGIMMAHDEVVKFASCQKNQVSMELGHLGGGHGLFTFSLLNGLTCLSDANLDSQISYEELRRYLHDNMQKLSNKTQTPLANNISNSEFSILHCEDASEVTPVINSSFRRAGTVQEKNDTQIDSIYKKIIDCIEQKQLITPLDSCAYSFYNKLQAEASPNAASKIQMANILLRSALEKFLDDLILKYSYSNDPRFSQEEINKALLSYQTIRTLSPKDYWLTTRNKSRYYFFKSFDAFSPNLADIYLAISYLDSARVIDLDGAQNYFALGMIYFSLNNYFEADNCFMKIKEIAEGTNLYRLSLLWQNRIYKIVDEQKYVYTALHYSKGGAILFVKKGGTGNGSSWKQAFGDLQQALQAAKSGTEIWVAKGIYTPTNSTDRNISFLIKSGISLVGGFIGMETSKSQRDWEKNLTVLSGNIGDPNSSEDNSFTVVHTRNVTKVLVDGFIIQDGNASNSNEKEQEGYFSSTGAAWYDEASQGTHAIRIQNCIFQYNKSIYAAGIYCTGMNGAENRTEILNCSFIQNEAQVEGGGALIVGNGGTCRVLIEKSKFISNFALYGGAIFSRAIHNGINTSVYSTNFLQNNQAYIDGADFFTNRDNLSICKPILVNNVSSNSPSSKNILDEVKLTPNNASRIRPSSRQ